MMKPDRGSVTFVLAWLAAAIIAGRTADGAILPAAADPGAERAASFSKLLPLDEAHAADFRRAFDDAKDLPRYIVALSPT